MLKLIIKGDEVYDEATNRFGTVNDIVVELEHSLLSVSKWESKFEKPFLANTEKTVEEIVEYVRFMIITPGLPPEVLNRFTNAHFEAVNNYINSKQSATTFGQMPDRRGPGETITSELVYYWMVQFNIPFECERWHLNRLFSLIQICNIKQSKPKKMSKGDIARRNRELNEQRRAQLGTSG
jgi:hypothetical protein